MSKCARFIQCGARSSHTAAAAVTCPLKHPVDFAPDDILPWKRKHDATPKQKVRPFKEIPGPKGLYSIPFLGTALQLKPFSRLL